MTSFTEFIKGVVWGSTEDNWGYSISHESDISVRGDCGCVIKTLIKHHQLTSLWLEWMGHVTICVADGQFPLRASSLLIHVGRKHRKQREPLTLVRSELNWFGARQMRGTHDIVQLTLLFYLNKIWLHVSKCKPIDHKWLIGLMHLLCL